MKFNFFQWRSLKTRVTVLMLIIFLTSLWSLEIYVNRMLRRDIQSLVAEQQSSTVFVMAEEVTHELQDRLTALEQGAQSVSHDLLASPLVLQSFLEERLTFRGLFNAGTFITGMDGSVIASVPLSAGRVGVNYMDRDYIGAALRQGKTIIGRPVIGRMSHAPGFGIAVPIHDAQGKVVGALVGVTDLSQPNFLDHIAGSRYGKTGGYVIAAPQHQLVVTATNRSRILAALPASGVNPMMDRYANGYEGTDIFVDPLGEEVLASVRRIAVAGWYVAVAMPTAEALAPIRTMQQRLLLAAIFLTLLIGALTWWMVKRQLAQLQTTVTTLVSLAQGDRPALPLPIARQDEIGQLIGGFNQLLHKLAQREDALRESRERFDLAVQGSSDGIWDWDIANKTIYVSDRWCGLLGYRSVEMSIGPDGWVPWIHPQDAERAREHLLLHLKFKIPYTMEFRLKTRSGEYRWVLNRGQAIWNTQGRATRMVGSTTDVTERREAEESLEENREKYLTLSEATFEAVLISENGRCLEQNTRAQELFGYSAQEVVGKSAALWIAPEDRDRVLQNMMAGDELRYEATALRKNGTRFPAIICAKMMHYRGRLVQVTTMADITERNQAEANLRVAATAFESQEGMIVTDAHRVILRVNKAFTEITDYTAEDAVGQNPRLLSSGRHDAAFYAAMWASIGGTGSWQGEIWNRRKSGEVYPERLAISAVVDANRNVTNYVAAFSDITQKKQAQDEIQHLAFTDPLTGLPNRRLLLDHLKQALATCGRNKRKGALLFIDLDNFKTLNDTHGHYQGDFLLEQVAQRLSVCSRECDTVARLGGDEFVVMVTDLSENTPEAATQVEAVSAKIFSTLTQIYQLDGLKYHITPSIGITLFGGEQYESIDETLKRADLAMYQAKAAGRNTVRFFDPQMQAVVSARAAMEAGLRDAVRNSQFILFYQAQMSDEPQITGAEALVRWQHPVRGLVAPAEFIALAEETGLILPLGQWVLQTACTQLALWAGQPQMAQLTVAVNVSARQFHQRDFVNQVLAVLAHTGANPKRLKLELTESVLVANVEDVIAKMNALKALGVGFSLDDFGTGYSSLSYLKRLPLDELKIDQGFVKDILLDPNDAAIARMVVALADSLGLVVIAEGVETQAQRDFLANLGCHAYQGYLFGHPLPVQEFEAFVNQV